MSKPLTITPEVERVARECNPTVAWMEVDALRAALAATEAKLAATEHQRVELGAKLLAAVGQRDELTRKLADAEKHADELAVALRDTLAAARWPLNHTALVEWYARRAARDGQEGTR